jgi:arylsulfatase A-like enzyme
MGGASGVSQPNIVLIVMDDTQTSDLDAISKTRALLGDAGTTFPNLFASTPLCSPSRASLLTGQFAHNHGVVGNQGATGVGGATRRLASAIARSRFPCAPPATAPVCSANCSTACRAPA